MSRRPPFYWWVVAFGTALLLCYGITCVELWRHVNEGKDYGYYSRLKDGVLVVSWVGADGPAGGRLRVGDRILAVDGYRGPAWLLAHLTLLVPSGQTYTLSVERAGTPLEVPLQPKRVRGSGPVYWGFPLQLSAGLVCFAVGIWMGLSKPADRTVQLACFSFLALAALHLYRILLPLLWLLDWQARPVMMLLSLTDPLPVATGYLFAARFPKRVPENRWWRAAAVLICCVVGAEWLIRLPLRFFLALGPALAVSVSRWLEGTLAAASSVPNYLWKIENVLIFAAIAAVMVRNYRRLEQPDLRRRIRWVMLGIVLAIVPMTVVYSIAAFKLAGGQTNLPWFGAGEEIVSAFVGFVLSITIAYGVLQHRLLDIHVAVRRSIQYMLAKRVLQAALSLPVVLIVARAAWNPGLTVRDLLFGSYFSLAVMAVAALGLLCRRTLLLAVDRKFFREAYNQEQILRTLIEEIKSRDSVEEISRLVSDQVEAALHPRRVLVFYRRESRGDFTLGHSSGGVNGELRVSANCAVLRLLEEGSGARDFPPAAADAPASQDHEYFEKLGVRLMAPITGTDRRLIGILMLCEKRSESPYTSADRNLLEAIAAQIGVVYENIALRESARREAQIKRSVLARLDGTTINLLHECPRCGACFDRALETCAADGSALELTLPVERIVDGVYRLERRVGTGAMGAVYRATDLRLGRPVAVKLMIGSLFGNHAALRRFEREARAAARLSHPNIVAIHDFGTLGTDGAYLVMEMIEGLTLRAELRKAGTLPPAVAALRFDQLCAGLSAAHAAGVVHRDLKPENLIVEQLTGGGELLKILDFGLAKVTAIDDAGTASVTMAGAVVGTLGYMSPEQLLGEEVDERTDTFSAGVLVVESLTGRRPFAGVSFQELLHATLNDSYRLPGNEDGTGRLNGVLGRCLAKRREDRPRIAEIRRQLVDAIHEFPAQARTSGPVPEAAAEESTIDGTRA